MTGCFDCYTFSFLSQRKRASQSHHIINWWSYRLGHYFQKLKILVYSPQLFCLISFSCWQNSLGHWKPRLRALTSQWKPTGSYLQWCKDACLNFTHSWNGFQGHLPHEPDTRWDESSTQYFLQSSWKRGVWIGLFRWSRVWRRRAKLPGPCWFSGGLGTRGSCLCPKNFRWNEQIPHRVDSVSFGHLPQEVSCS